MNKLLLLPALTLALVACGGSSSAPPDSVPSDAGTDVDAHIPPPPPFEQGEGGSGGIVFVQDGGPVGSELPLQPELTKIGPPIIPGPPAIPRGPQKSLAVLPQLHDQTVW
jgi:hypothetical protein